ncbi:MAG: hypothetical protein R2706_04570 [Acidimicrobiales bacterium]
MAPVSSSVPGATAATLIPALADDVEHVTMLQRSPTYFATGRNADDTADMLRELEIDESWIHEIVRRKTLYDQAQRLDIALNYPEETKAELFGAIREILGPDYDIDTHFTPSYRPWRQRIAFVPDGDLFGDVWLRRVVTDEIDRFTDKGILLKSGETLEADIIVTATGFNLNVLGDIDFSDRRHPAQFCRHGDVSQDHVHWHSQHGLGLRPISVRAGRFGPTCSATSCAAPQAHGEQGRVGGDANLA